tara:strand:- start:210 stop:521 length:312 start_codon:yes stop_codon:yes gene_type:complete
VKTTVRILDAAAQEAIEAAAWYELERPGLGVELSEAFDAALDVIEEGLLPLSPIPDEGGDVGAKRLILDRFPYDVVIIEEPGEVVVISFAHHSRKPGYWRDRA